MNDLPALPAYLSLRRDQIADAEGFASPAGIRGDRWRETLPDEVELDLVLSMYPSGVGRHELWTLSEQACRDDKESAYCGLFFASMLWGFGRRGFGPSRVRRMRTGRAPVTGALLQETAHLVAEGKHAEAIRRLDAIWLGVSFGSKYLYAAGLAHDLRLRPLVLDLNVELALRELAATDGFETARFALMRNGEIIRSGSAYDRYVQLLHAWGVALDCPADRVEFFLFTWGKKLRKAGKR